MRLACCLLILACAAPSSAGEEKFLDLLGKDLSGWKVVPETAKNTFAVKPLDDVPTLIVSGKPLAYLHTKKKLRDFVLRFEWKAAKESQGGVLIAIQEPHKIWPRCIQCQIQEDNHGRLFTMGGAPGTFTWDRAAQRKAVLPDDWNQTELTNSRGKISLKINGVPVAGGQSDLGEGPIGFQSEGPGCLFRKVQLWEK